MITVNELFSGIGAFRKALINLGVPHEIIGISEIDKYAIKSYEAIYGKTRNYGDISKVSRLVYADLWTYGFPCQDISAAGYQKGIVKGETRSGLLYEVQRLLSVAEKHDELPKYIILENVKNIVSRKFFSQFDSWLCWLGNLGYNSYWQIINAKDCGIPQTRERVFVVSIRKDIDNGFEFPAPIPLEKELRDYFESSDEFPINPQKDGTCRTIKAQYAHTSLANFLYSDKFGATGVINKQSGELRKLTPLECWRLMGFSDDDFRKAEQECSNAQLYKQAGNSIVVPVIERIICNMIM